MTQTQPTVTEAQDFWTGTMNLYPYADAQAQLLSGEWKMVSGYPHLITPTQTIHFVNDGCGITSREGWVH